MIAKEEINKLIENSTILLVDDNIKNLELASNLLNRKNYEIAVANSGAEALEFLKEFKPDLILLDIMMPKIDGYDVCRRIKASEDAFHIPVIFLTAKSEPADLVKGFDAGGVDYIRKPFRPEELLMRVRTHLEIKHYRDVIENQNKSLLQLNKKLEKLNEEKTNLLRITAHDLKNPLTAIYGLLEIVEKQRNFMDGKDVDDIVKSTRHSTKTAINIAKDLLDVHAFEEGRLHLNIEDSELVPMIEKSIRSYAFNARDKNIAIRFAKPPEKYYVRVDKKKFERIVDNLLSNALKFSQADSEILISIEEIYCKEIDSQFLRIKIKDEGPGLDKNDQKKLFSKFAKLTPRPTGGETSSGLGLSIVKQLVEGMDGKVWCETELGKGAEFIVEFQKF